MYHRLVPILLARVLPCVPQTSPYTTSTSPALCTMHRTFPILLDYSHESCPVYHRLFPIILARGLPCVPQTIPYNTGPRSALCMYHGVLPCVPQTSPYTTTGPPRRVLPCVPQTSPYTTSTSPALCTTD